MNVLPFDSQQYPLFAMYSSNFCLLISFLLVYSKSRNTKCYPIFGMQSFLCQQKFDILLEDANQMAGIKTEEDWDKHHLKMNFWGLHTRWHSTPLQQSCHLCRQVVACKKSRKEYGCRKHLTQTNLRVFQGIISVSFLVKLSQLFLQIRNNKTTHEHMCNNRGHVGIVTDDGVECTSKSVNFFYIYQQRGKAPHKCIWKIFRIHWAFAEFCQSKTGVEK